MRHPFDGINLPAQSSPAGTSRRTVLGSMFAVLAAQLSPFAALGFSLWAWLTPPETPGKGHPKPGPFGPDW